MSLTHVGTTAWVSGTGAVTPPDVTGVAIGDLVIIYLVSKYDNAVLASDPAGWDNLGTAFNTGRSTGNDNGNLRARAFSKVWQSGDTMPSLSPSPNNASATKATAYRATSGAYSVQGGLFADDTAGTPLAFATGSTLGLKSGDWLEIDQALNGDAPTWGTTTVTATGATFAALTLADDSTISGTDMRFRHARTSVTSGTASGNLTVSTVVAGTTTNAVGVGLVLRVREATSPLTQTPTDNEGLTDAQSVSQAHTIAVTDGGGGGGGGGGEPRVLFVHDDPTPTVNDTYMVGVLEGDGMTVTLRSEASAPPTDTTDYDVVVHSESGSSTSTAITAYPTMAVPLVFLETSWNNINMASAAATNPTSTDSYDIIATSHEIVAGLSDPFTWRSSVSGNYGVTTAEKASGAVQICAPVGNTGHCTVLAAESGATLTSGTAPARRVCAGVGVGSAPAAWLVGAEVLFVQMVRWAANVSGGGGEVGMLSDSATVTLTPSGPVNHTHTPTDNMGLTDNATVQLSGPPGAGPFQIGTGTVEPESHGYVVPIIDSNGNWYRIAESQLLANNQPVAWKSTDDGETWAEMDAANRPGTDTGSIGDLESGWVTWDAADKIITFTWQRSYVVWSGFRTSDHPTNPDTWVSNTRENMAAITGSPQYASHTSPTDQSYEWVFYNNSTTKPSYRSRTSSGSYGTQADVDSSGQHPAAILDTANVSHILYRKNTNELHYKKLTSGGTLDGASTRVDTGNTHTVPIAHAAPQAWVNGGNTYVGCLYINGSADLKFVLITNGTPGSEETVTANTVNTDPGATVNQSAIISLAVDPVTGTMYAMWAEAATNEVMYAERPAGGAWSSPVPTGDSPAFVPAWVYAKVNTRPDTSRVLGYTFSQEVDDDNSGIWFNKMELTGGAGTDHTVTPTDTEALSDSASLVQAHSRSQADNLGLTDATRTVAQGHTLATTDALGLTDAATVVMSKTVSSTDAEGLSDLATPVLTMSRPVADSEGLTDAATTVQGHALNRIDPVGLTDSVVFTNGYGVPQSDALGLTDSITLELGKTVQQVDGENLTDSASVAHTDIEPRSDALGLTDAVAAALADVVSLSDALGLTDTATAVVSGGTTPVDALGLTDSASLALGHSRAQVDAEGLTDSALVVRNLAQTPVDNLGLADTAVRSMSLARPTSDAAALTDSTNMVLSMSSLTSDAVGLTDVANVTMSGASSTDVVDNMNLTDAVILATADVEPVSDSLSLSDTTVVGLIHGRSTTDALGAVDSVVVSRGLASPTVDAEGLTDTQAVVLGMVRLVGDALGLSDAVTVTVERPTVVSDAMSLADAVAVTSALARTIADGLGLTDAVSLAQSAVQRPADLVGLTDSVDVALAAPNTYADVLILTDDAFVVLAATSTPAIDATAEFGGAGGGTAVMVRPAQPTARLNVRRGTARWRSDQ